MLIQCPRCGNETRTAQLLSPLGEIMVSGPADSSPLPISAQVCVACGHIDLYAPQSFDLPEQQKCAEPVTLPDVVGNVLPPAATSGIS